MPDLEEKKENFDNGKSFNRREAVAFFWEVVKIVIISLAIIVPVRYYIVQPFFVKGASMESTFDDSDYVLIDEVAFRFRQPERGEVIVFRAPKDQSQFYIKRIIGLPNETVQIKNSKVIIFNDKNPKGFILDETTYLDRGVQTEGDFTVKVGSEEYFVLGDNREHSSDSRIWGTVNKSLITGRVFFRAWPFNKVTKFKPVSY